MSVSVFSAREIPKERASAPQSRRGPRRAEWRPEPDRSTPGPSPRPGVLGRAMAPPPGIHVEALHECSPPRQGLARVYACSGCWTCFPSVSQRLACAGAYPQRTFVPMLNQLDFEFGQPLFHIRTRCCSPGAKRCLALGVFEFRSDRLFLFLRGFGTCKHGFHRLARPLSR